MARLNNIIKFTMINVNILITFAGAFFIGFACYLRFGNWGDLDPGFFIGTSVILALFGISTSLAGCIGCQGINNQTMKFGFWTGRKITFVHLVLLIFGLAGEVYLLKMSLSANQGFSDVYDLLKSDPDTQPKYADFEHLFAEKFNRFFFGAASECKTTLYYWFWDWVSNNCPDGISQLSCQGCYDYSYTFCEADANSCFANEDYNEQCPYIICRAGIMHYMQIRVRPFAIVLLSLVALQIFLILFDLMVLCFNPRDTLEQILYKSGTLSKSRNTPSGPNQI